MVITKKKKVTKKQGIKTRQKTIKKRIREKTNSKIDSKVVTIDPTQSEGFIQKVKDIIKSELPKKEKVRVRTVIVEKPVIIRDETQKTISIHTTPKQKEEPKEVFDSKRSRYARTSIATGFGLVKNKKEEFDSQSDFSEKSIENEEDTDYTEEDEFEDEEHDEENEDEEELGEENNEEDFSEEDAVIEHQSLQRKKYRSRGMFNNIWWKKALFWSILFWLFVLAISMAMQAMKLIMVDLTRQWWVLLGIIILIGMVYFKFIDKKRS